ncbi:YifB family Mg chelatase-like AAA ATPase [Corynebacterium sp.]|uniref:YifB family Mg chelatase-like AAA ATPase n=1 Tax=Corynebacterium sp. TaxID=1720 RepID=UPI0026DACA4C|nr:YifB family Mg chelatase-like AAA ATPase [Corynebacterium sp.]MDO5075817.1 YifB family Mg chelatase-like AAA ATPase [Corynebacterium sp.]
MGFGNALSAMLTGVQAHIVTVETTVGAGLPGMHIVGLADVAIAESRERIRAAVAHARLPWPKTKIVVSLSPAGLRKSGSHFDLAIAMSVVAADMRDPALRQRMRDTLFFGELGLDGRLRAVEGLLPVLLAAREAQITTVIIPEGNAAEAALVDCPRVLVARSLAEVFAWVQDIDGLHPPTAGPAASPQPVPDMADVAGQTAAKHAVEVAAAGGHHLMMLGPPGSGKSMLAARLPGILPPLDDAQVIAVTAVHSVAGNAVSLPVRRAPFVAPHHSVTRAALLGGGAGNPKPGAVSLAHHGVLFLDEVSEIPAGVLDCLRTPLEAGCVRLVRSRRDVCFPAQFQLLLAANPCGCGAEQPHQCRCSATRRMRYLSNVSGPLRDRLDVFVHTQATGAVLRDNAEASATIAERVAAARERALARFGCVNGQMGSHTIRRDYPADDDAMALLAAHLRVGDISQRGVDRALKVAWTLCDLQAGTRPNLDHVARALEFREGLSLEYREG